VLGRFLRAVALSRPAQAPKSGLAIIAAVTPVILIAAGGAALAAGLIVLASYGARLRVGRLLATTPRSTVAEAVVLATSGLQRYVRVDGRLDSDEDFEDHDHRPLVFRRTRLEARTGRDWQQLGEKREQVDFDVREGLDSIRIDPDALDDGLVVVPRESVGTAADIADRVPPAMPPTTPVRFRIDQVSSVEHAIVLGVPTRNGTGRATMTAGLGRPLVLTTLEPAEAMRILAGSRGRAWLAAMLLVSGALLLAFGLLWLAAGTVVGSAVAASPTPTELIGGDPRSPQEGPGLVGNPLGAILGVLGIGLVAVLATSMYVRLTGGRRPRG
jgi:hypothetical protein